MAAHGLDLDVAPYFANSLRGAVGADVKGDFSLWGFDLTPEGRFGYRYDFVQNAVKSKRRLRLPAAAPRPATP